MAAITDVPSLPRDRHLPKPFRKRDDDSELLHRASCIIVCAGPSPSAISSWDVLVRALKSAEPSIRHLALTCLGSCLGSWGATPSQERNRSLGALLLGQLAWCYGATLPPSIVKDLCQASIKNLHDLQSCRSPLSRHRPGHSQARSRAVQALDMILQSRLEVPPPDFALITQDLTDILLEPQEGREHDLVRAQAVLLLANLPGTLRNRQRVQTFWPLLRPLIHRAIKYSGGNPEQILTVALSRFVSQWYGRVPDAILDRFPLYDQLSGYSELQYSALMNSDKEGVVSGRNSLREDDGPADYLGIVDKEEVLAFIKRYSRRVQIVDILPEKFDLTFQAESILNAELFFDSFNNKRTLHLTNRSSKQAHRFTIQICPTRLFTVCPAFGEIAPHSSVPITVKFERIAPLEKAIGHGYVRLRSWTGFAFERLPISYYNGPFLQILNAYIDFGACPLGRRLKRRLYVKNIGISAMNCYLDLCYPSLPGDPDHMVSPFEVSPSSASINPGSIVAFDILFKAQTQQRIETQMLLSSADQQLPVLLCGTGVYPIVISESLLDMGPCMHGQKVATPLNVTNLAPYTLLVQFETAVRGLVIPPTAIPAGQTRTIIANWDNDGHSGYIEDLVYVRVPECAQIPIKFRAYVGIVLSSPVQSPLRLPFVSVHMVLQSVIPIQNNSSYDAEFVVDGLDGTPFYIMPLDGARLDRDRKSFVNDFANKPAPSMLKEILLDSRDRHYTVKAYSTLYLVVMFSSHKPGFFEREFSLSVISPRSARWPPFQLRAAAILDNEKFPLKKLLMFFGEQGAFKSSELTRLPSKDFEGSIESRLIFGATWEGIPARSETFAFHSFDEWGWTGNPLSPITVENLSARPHNFSMMLTHPFVGTSSRHGICGAFDKMSIPSEIVRDHHLPSPIDGFVIIRDNFAKTSMCWVHLLETHLIEIVPHHRERKIIFNQVDVDTVSQRPITLINRSGLKIPLRIQIEYDRGNEDSDRGASNSARFWCDHSYQSLDRWEQRTIWILFRSRSPGRYVARLQVIYADPKQVQPDPSLSEASNDSASVASSWFVAFFSDLVVDCGLPALTVDCDLVDFGHSGVGLQSFHNLTISNHNHQQAIVFLVVEAPFGIDGPAPVVTIAPNSSSTVILSFHPAVSGRFCERLQIICGDWFEDVMLFGECGIMSLSSSMGSPQSGPSVNADNDDHEINMGAVRVCTESTRFFRLINNGTIDIKIAKIVTSADDGLTYTIVESDATDVADLPRFGQEPLDSPMIDWDEVAYHKTYVSIANDSAHGKGRQKSGPDDFAMPYRLSPGAFLPLQLMFSRYLTGIFKPILKVEVKQSSNQTDTYVFAMKFNVHDVMEIMESHIDFGTVPYLQTRQLALSFQNDCIQPVSWHLEFANVMAVRTTNKTKTPIRNNVFEAHPASGIVQGSGQQQVMITFNSAVVHCLCTATAVLYTSDIGSSTVELSACSGAPLLTASESTVPFGCINLGSSKSKVVMLTNEGELPAAFIVKLTFSKHFHVVPMRGVIQARSRQPLWIKFAPSGSETVTTQLRVDWGDSERLSNRIVIDLSGSGGSSQIVIKQSCIDFGMAMLEADTVKVLRVYNAGAAEALLRIDLPDSSLTVADCDGTFFVKPGSHRDLEIIFHPTSSASISGHASIYSQEAGTGNTDRLQVQLKGRVGVPNLVLGPTDLIGLYTLNFGACVVRRSAQRQFYVENNGNMDVPFEVKLFRNGYIAQHENLEIGTQEHAGSQTIQSCLPQLMPGDLQWRAILASMVPAEPQHFTIEPRSGVFTQGSRVHFMATFSPEQSDEYLDVAVSIANPSSVITLIATALSDEPAIDLDMAERVLDFGLCRCQNTFKRKFRILNKGSIPYQYHIGPDMREAQWLQYRDDYEAARLSWTAHMKALGFTFQYGGVCPRRSHDTITVLFTAPMAGQFIARARIVCSGGYEQIELHAVGGNSHLQLTRFTDESAAKPKSSNGDVIDFGLRPIGQISQAVVLLRNTGMLATGFLIGRTMPDQFDVYPLSGRIEPGGELPIRVTFKPSTFGLYQFDMRIKGVDNTVDSWRIVGRGGKGNLQVHYLQICDQRLKGLDFGIVNLGFMVEKSLVIYNDGEVDLDLWAECDQPLFAIRLVVQAQPYKTVSDLDSAVRVQRLHKSVTHAIKAENKFSDTLMFAQSRSVDVTLGPKHFAVASVFVAASNPGKYNGMLILASQFNTLAIALRAETGTVVISHNGDLQFGSVGVDHLYEKQITLVNNGTIATSARLYWEIPHTPAYKSAVLVLAGPNISFYAKLWRQTTRLIIRIIKAAKAISGKGTLDSIVHGDNEPDGMQIPRRKQMTEVVEPLMVQLANVRLTNAEHEANVRNVEQVLAPTHPLFETAVGLTNMGYETSRRLALLQNAFEKKVVSDPAPSPLTTLLQIIGPKLNSIRGVSQISSATIGADSRHLRHKSSVNSVSPIRPSFVAVEPSRIRLEVDVPVTVKITASFPALPTFIGSLIMETDLVGCPPYAVRISSSPMNARLIINDASPMRFGRISLGSAETQTRILTNTGALPIRFAIRHRNFGLAVNPSGGYLEAEDSVQLVFTFRPLDEQWQKSPVSIETDSTDTVEFEFLGAGGVPKLHLASFDRYDFGRCMAGRTSKKAIRIFNIGNAQLPILRCLLDQTVIFKKGADWPAAKFVIEPDAFYDLNVEFTPQNEDVFRGRIVIETDSRVVPIELTGTGREALLTYQTQNVDLSGTIVGNLYRRDISLNNVSDLEYPLEISIGCAAVPELAQDLSIEFTQLTLNAFEQRRIFFLYKPTRVVDTVATIRLTSIYSEHDIPVPVTTGTAIIDVDTDLVDFGQFQKGFHCSKSVTIRNSGTIAVAFRLLSSRDPDQLDFTVSRWKGLLVPDRDVEIIFKTKLSQLGAFEDEICLETQIDGKRHYIRVKGQCETPIIDPTRFQRVDFGDCLVGETATQSFVIENSGGFPLTYKMKATFPIKVMPNQGSVQPLSRQRFSVIWIPSGGYGLRSTLKVHTNLGVFDVNIKGRGAYPRFTISSAFLDFGIGAVHHVYEQKFKIINRGRVAIRFSIPFKSTNDPSLPASAVGERHVDEVCPGYTLSPMRGSLAAGESVVVRVKFEPREFRKYSGNIVIESKSRYREVAVIGAGGVLRLDVPASLDLGSCPAGFYREFAFSLANSGDVPVTIRPASIDLPPNFALFYQPQSLTMVSMAKQTVKGYLKVDSNFSGPFQLSVVLVANESTWRIVITGYALSLQNAFSHLAGVLMSADISLRTPPVAVQQWPNALSLDPRNVISSTNRSTWSLPHHESDESAVRSILRLIMNAVSEMSKAPDSSRPPINSFSERLTNHIESGITPIESEYQDNDDLASLVMRYEPEIRRPDISLITSLDEPRIDDDPVLCITASPPLFLAELTIK